MGTDDKTENIYSHIVSWFKTSAQWIVDHLADPVIAQSIRQDLGLKPGAEIPAAAKGTFAQFASGLDPDVEGLSDTLEQVFAVGPELKTLSATLETDKFPANQIAYTLLKLAATDSIRLRAPLLFALSRAALFVEEDTESFIMLDPARLLRNARGEDLPTGEALAQRLAGGGALVLQILSMLTSSQHDKEKPGLVDVFSGWDLAPDSVTPKADLVSTRATTFYLKGASQTTGGLLVSILAVPTAHGGPGLFIALGGSLSLKRETDTSHFQLDAGFPGAFDIYIPFKGSRLGFAAHSGDVNPFFKFAINNGSADQPAFRIGEPNGTRLDVYQSEFGIDVSKQTAGFRFGLHDAELVIAAGTAGGFLSQIVGDGAKVRFSVGLIADTDGGFRLDGGTNARASLPIGRTIAGALTVHSMDLALGPSSTGGDLGLEVSGSFTAALGPFTATVDRLGFELEADRRDNGNMGPFHVGVGLKPPSGIGLLLDSELATGGGYLFADPVNNEYAGALELKFSKFNVKAIGVLADGKEGWSLLLLLYAQTPPIQLGAGFTLNGIGGLIGVQRGMDITKLGAALKTKAFDDILFPADPVGNAPRIINELRSFFPFSDRSLTFGPMFDIGYGEPRILYIRVAILFQINDVFHKPLGAWSLARIALVGQLRLELGATKANPGATVVKLIVDVLGFWDLEKKSYGFLATLRDSKIGTIDITGGLAVYGQYGADSKFILAAGGFNPRFKDVPAEAKGALDRLGASFKVGSFSLKLTGYFALTPGTIQAGFDVIASASLGPIGLKGELGFDVLVYRDPHTYFIADFKFSAVITYRGHTLAGVKVTGFIEGPGAWHVKGKLTFSILWWDIDKSFDEAWGSLPPTSVVIQTNVQALLATEVARRENWSIELPSGSDAMVTFAPPVPNGAQHAHPLSRVAFSQTVVPLGLTLQRFGDTRVTGTTRFDITKLTIGGQIITARVPVREHFARAQFLNMSDDDKLTKPSFEEMDSGVEFSSAAYRVSPAPLLVTMEYETVYLDIDPVKPGTTRPEPALARLQPTHELVSSLATQGAAARAPQRADEQMRSRIAARVAVTAAPLAVADRTAFAVDPVVPLTGQGTTVAMIAEQRFRPVDAARSQLIEQYELVPN
ncbi:MAG TPA: DUF6603 domain-containing protein [Gemmatimonadaceae bacterium]|nr:DUF6603 domain-containing protein [Gemmatimonadaceae bacterium]